jgi:hypothetical protein
MKSNNFKAKNILNKNLKKCNIKEDTEIPYISRFLYCLLKEQEDLPKSEDVTPSDEVSSNIESEEMKSPDKFTPELNKKDFENSLDKETKPDQFDTEGLSPESTAETISTIREWSKKLDEFAEFLNDPSSTTSEGKPSLHKILSDGDRSGSLLRGVTRKASDSITRIAGEVEKLKEILNTYIITAPKKLRDTEGQPGWNQF